MTRTKTCAKCGRSLPVSEFRKHKGYGDGFEGRCKACMAEDSRLRRQAKQSIQVPPPKSGQAIAARYRKMLEPTAEAFEAFYNEFTADALGGLPPHGKVWVEAALNNRLLLLNVPPRHAKTTIMAIWFPIWRWAANRNTQVIIVSKTVKLGEKISRKIAHELETNTKLIEAFGRFKPQDDSRPWRVGAGELEIEGKDRDLRSGDLSLQIRGAGQQILGMEADWVIADDMTDRRVAMSEVSREDEWEYFLGDVMTRLAPDGRAFCIGQRVHGDDIYGRLGRLADDDGTPSWHMERTPAILDEEGGRALWPGQWPYEKLVEKRREIGGSLFACMYQQAPEVSGEFVPRWWLTGNGTPETPGCFDDQRTVGTGWRPTNEEGEFLPITRVISVDPSPTMYAGIVVADIVYLPQQQYFYCGIVDIVREKLGLREMVDTIDRLTREYGPTVCIFETNAAKWLHEDPAWNRVTPMFRTVIGHATTQHNKRDALMGVWSLASDFEAGRIRFPMGDDESRDTSAYLIDEVLAYPNGRTDDVLMALWFIKSHYRKLAPLEALPTRFNRFGFGQRTWNMDKKLRAGSGAWRPR